MRNPTETTSTALRRRLMGRAARALGEPINWTAVHAAEAATERHGLTIEGGAE